MTNQIDENPARAEPMPKEDMAKLAIDDVRQRIRAAVELGQANQRKFDSFLRLYVTIVPTSIATFVVIAHGLSQLPRALAIPPAVLALGLCISIALLLLALRQVDTRLPGREPDFWLWALEHAESIDSTARHYLIEEQSKLETLNNNNNAATSKSALSRKVAVATMALAFVAFVAIELVYVIRL